MGRGFFAGSLWGGVIGVITIALASQLIGWRDLSSGDPAAVATAEPESNTETATTQETVAQTDETSDDPVGETTDQASAETADGSDDASAETASAEVPAESEEQPQPEAVVEAPEAPTAQSGEETADVVISNETIGEAADSVASDAPALSDATEPDTAEVTTPEITDVAAEAPDIQVAAVEGITAPGEGDAPALSTSTDTQPSISSVAVTEAAEPDSPVQNGLEAPAAPETVAEPLPGPAPRPTGVGEAPDAPTPGAAPLTLAESDGLDEPSDQSDILIVAEAPPEPLPEPEPEPVVEAETETVEEADAEPADDAENETVIAETDDAPQNATTDTARVDTETADASETDQMAVTTEDAATTESTATDEPVTAEAETAPASTEEVEPEPIVIGSAPESASDETDTTEIAAAPQTTEELPRVLRIGEGDGNSLIQRGSVARLPGIGQTAPEPEESVEDTDVAETDVTDETSMEETPADALRRFAQDFEAPEDLPLVSVVLIHTGGDPGALSTLSLPVSFAVDAGLPNATDIANAYRAAGREVVMIPSLPPRARPSDVEQALQINLQTVPEAVALMDSPDASFQGDRQAMAQVVEAAAETGHGLLTFPRGLNSAQQLAARSAVPAGLIFRDLDRQNATRGAISRSLDQAVLRAGPDTAVILVARTERNTLEALQDWAGGGRAASVALVPVSTALIGR